MGAVEMGDSWKFFLRTFPLPHGVIVLRSVKECLEETGWNCRYSLRLPAARRGEGAHLH
jgi:hypothetical protein